MSDRMTPMQPIELLNWLIDGIERGCGAFSVGKRYTALKDGAAEFLGRRLETPVGPAAGPHTQLAENIIAAYYAGARFFELKTVQVIDGEDLPVEKPCIFAADECYNVEWSTELRVPQALEEYIKAWFIIKIAAREYDLGDPDGFQFNMSVGYDYDGITSKKIDDYIEGLRNAESLPIWNELKTAAKSILPKLKHVDGEYIDSISPAVSDSITLSTLHGCPPQEIERIASYLICEKKINTFIKCNPTLLGYEKARSILDRLGYDYIEFDDHHFKEDLQYSDAVPMLKRLTAQAEERGLGFGVKITNTFPVDIAHNELPGTEMYMSGRALFPLSITVADMLTQDFDGKLRISLSGGADADNIEKICGAGIWPVTVATTLLKAGGYDRLKQIAEKSVQAGKHIFTGIDKQKLNLLREDAVTGDHYAKAIKPLPSRKIKKTLPLLNCFTAPCSGGCPIEQDIPAYLGLAGQGKYEEALNVILDKNPLPFITGTLCPHFCMQKCTRCFYEEPIQIRDVKLQCAERGADKVLGTLASAEKNGKIAVIGGGPAGIAAAFFLARQGKDVTLFEKEEELGGIVRYVIPAFRIDNETIKRDTEFMRKLGVTVKTGEVAPSVKELQNQGFEQIVLAIGAYQPGHIELEAGEALGVLQFLRNEKAGIDQNLGEHVIVIGGGNTAMDAARAAKRAKGVQSSSIVYRRTKRFMPADEEELLMAIEDGVEFKELLSPKSLKDGKLFCAVMELGEPDASGRRRPVETDEIVELPCTTLITAVGEKPDAKVFETQGIAVDERGKAVLDENNMTSIDGVYIVGDAAAGPATVVEAIADARLVSDAITDDRNKKHFTYDDNRQREKKGVLVYAADVPNESDRCLECNIICENCVDVCPNRANVSVSTDEGLQIIHIDRLCNECGNCETFCPYIGAPYKDKLTLFSSEKDFVESKNEGFFVRPDGKYLIRLFGSEYVTAGDDLAPGIRDLICGAIDQFGFLINE